MTEFIVQVIATLLGALAAFELERQRQLRDERRDRIATLRQTLFILMERREFLLNLRRQALDPMQDHQMRTFALHPFRAVLPASTAPIDRLAFLLEGSGEVQLRARRQRPPSVSGAT